MNRTGKIGIVGSGFVGATAAYAMVMSGVGREIILVDIDEARARAEADDIRHAVPFAHPMDVHAGGYSDLAGCRVVVLTAGVNQRPGETRLELLDRNAAIFRAVVPSVLAHAPQAILVVASNPVDVTTHLTATYAAELGVPSTRVVGSGTTLDTARFRTLLGARLGVDAQHVHAYVLGEHGDSEVLAWSEVSIGGIPLDDYCRSQGVVLDAVARQAIDEGVRRAAYTIIQGKRATYYGIGAALARIVNAILRDQRAILTVCSPMDEVAGVRNVTVSLPHLVGGQGVLSTLWQPLAPEEETALQRSAQTVKAAIDSIHAGSATARPG
ncbi:MAG: L-lactate dehydrogenase [Chloroflexi bacterium]|nr:MAG: L-lactate dehydrogenase [Chloroflexota bacterium]